MREGEGGVLLRIRSVSIKIGFSFLSFGCLEHCCGFQAGVLYLYGFVESNGWGECTTRWQMQTRWQWCTAFLIEMSIVSITAFAHIHFMQAKFFATMWKGVKRVCKA